MSESFDDDVPSTEVGGFNPAHIGQPDKPTITRGRTFSESTRQAFKAAAEKIKSQLDEGADHDDLEPAGYEPEAERPKTAAAATSEPPVAAAAAQATPPPAAAPSPVASAVDAIAAERMAQVEAKEKALADREAQIRDHKGRFKEDPVMTLKDMVREAYGLDDKADIRPYVSDLVTEMSGELLGLEVPQDVRAKQERKKAERLIREHNASLTKRESELKAKEAETIEKAERARVVMNIKAELAKPDRAEKYKWLAASNDDGDPADIVYGVADAIIKRDPTWKPSLDDAADRANKFYEAKARASYEKYKHLLNPTPPKAPPAATASHQDRPSGSRARETLTNEQAAATATTAPNPGRALTNEDRRRASMRKFSASMRSDE